LVRGVPVDRILASYEKDRFNLSPAEDIGWVNADSKCHYRFPSSQQAGIHGANRLELSTQKQNSAYLT